MITNKTPFEWYLRRLWLEFVLLIHQVWRHNNLYLTRYFIVPTFWNHSVLLKIDQFRKGKIMVYYLSIFGKIVFVGTLDDDAIRI